jgi:hypothetical protein
MLPDEQSLHNTVQKYFNLGYTHSEMVGMFVHHIVVSKTKTERILRRLNLRRREESNPEDITRGIVQLHREGYSELGYRAAWRMHFFEIWNQSTSKYSEDLS